MAKVASIATYLLAMVISLCIHEAAHAWAATRQGDKTAMLDGRLTLNPFAHVDMLGTIILPVMGMFYGAPVLGWAKPVPINPRNFHDPRFGPFLVAIAGPISNLLLSFLCTTFAVIYINHLQLVIPENSFFFPIIKLSYVMIYLNAGLAFFNLIPIPPLDGAAMLELFLPQSLRELYETYVVPYGFMVLLLFLMTSQLSWIGSLATGYARLCEMLISLVLR